MHIKEEYALLTLSPINMSRVDPNYCVNQRAQSKGGRNRATEINTGDSFSRRCSSSDTMTGV